jgi:hypothetical protein
MISKEQKSNLAKLLATENITVEHKKVKTAYFIPKTRVLCLPIWEDMSNDLYDLLVGHEVGHALYTPTDENEFKKHKIPHSYFNVIEDIRIDKKMKNKYPGLRKSYYNGYNELIEKDFFGTSEIDVNKIRFIDRLNMFSKSGQRELIEFNDIEKEFITRSDKLETWADVVKLTKDIYAYSENEQFDEEEQEQLSNISVTMNQDQDGEEQDNQEGDSHEQQEQNEETSSSSGSDSDRPEDKEDKVDNKSSSQSDEKDTEKEKEEKQKDVGTGSGAGYNPNISDSNVSATDTNYQNNAKSLSKVDEGTYDNLYLTFPKVKSAVVEYDTIARLIDRNNKDFSMSKRLTEWKEYKNKCMRSVNYMAKEFEMKKRADAYTRTRTARTGMINTNALHSYKYNDDIFARIQIEPGAKNHGMIMIVDWSGSMHDKMYDTLCQTINLVLFCKAVNIPFQVYGFTDTNKTHFTDNPNYDRYGLNSLVFNYTNRYEKIMEECSLMQFVTSDMRVAKFNEAMSNLYQIAKSFSSSHIRSYNMRYMHDDGTTLLDMPGQLRLGGTPLDSAILCTIPVVNEFQTKNKIQKMNTVFLTDGCGHTNHNFTDYDKQGNLENSYSNYHCNINIKDGSYSFQYGANRSRSNHFSYHQPMLEYFKHKTGSTIIGYYVAGRTVRYWDIMIFTKKEGYDQYDNAKANIRKNKCHTITNIGYDEMFIIPRNNLKVEDEEVNITNDMTTAKMKAQFLKNFKTKKVSRVLLNKFVERVA